MCRQSPFFASFALALGLTAGAVAADNYWWTNGSGDGVWDKKTPPYNWESIPAWNPNGPRVACPPPPHGSASIYVSGNPATRATPLVIPAGYTADCTYGEEFGTIFGPEWGLHLDIYGSLTYKWYLVLAQALAGLTDPNNPDNDPNRSVVNMYSGSRIHGTADSTGSDKTRAEGIAIGTNWWAPLPYVTMNMYEGSECLVNWAWIGGHLNMYGGTFDVLTGVNMGIGTPANVPDNLIRVDIHKGKLVLPANFADQVQDWIRRGILKAYGMTPGLPGGSSIVIDTRTMPGRTIVTALPVAGPEVSQPNPGDGDANVPINPLLRWVAGIHAAQHRVYLGAGADDVENANDANHPNVTVAQANDSRLDAGFLQANTSYFWRVDEVNDAHPDKLWKGPVWSFTTGDYAVVDDFEGYTNDSPNRVFQTWIDSAGFSRDEFFPNGNSGNGSGALVGYDPTAGNIMETGIIHGGKQSMPLYYDNSSGTRYSETLRTFAAAQDWSGYGLTTLVVYFRGDLDNAPAPLYAKINGTRVSYSGNALTTAIPVWKQWNIDLASAGVNLKGIQSLTLGVGDGIAGGTGTLFIDDLVLYVTPPQIITPVDPGDNGLVGLYAMDGNVQDSSGKGMHGTPSGNPEYDQSATGYGKALYFDGVNDHVSLPVGPLINSLSSMTIAARVSLFSASRLWQRVLDFGTGTDNYMFLSPNNGVTGTLRFAIRTPTAAEQAVTASTPLTEGWHHVAIVIDGAAGTLQLYQDGLLVASGATAVLPKDLGNTTQNWLGRSQFEADPYFGGALDDLRIYDRALSPGEVRYLAGDR